MRKSTSKITVTVETAEGQEQEWVLDFKYYGGSAGAYYDPPESPDVDFTGASRGEERLSIEDFEARFGVTESQWGSWYNDAVEAVEESFCEDYDDNDSDFDDYDRDRYGDE